MARRKSENELYAQSLRIASLARGASKESQDRAIRAIKKSQEYQQNIISSKSYQKGAIKAYKAYVGNRDVNKREAQVKYDKAQLELGNKKYSRNTYMGLNKG